MIGRTGRWDQGYVYVEWAKKGEEEGVNVMCYLTRGLCEKQSYALIWH